MNIKIITVGKLKEDYLKAGIAEYTKRLSRFAKTTIIELADEKTPDKASEAQNQQILMKEGARIVLAIEGKQFPSEAFAQKLADVTLAGYSDITFIIGGSLGLDPTIKQRANMKMSFGLLTLPHQLMRLVLVEQIYRTFMIHQGSPYHK